MEAVLNALVIPNRTPKHFRPTVEGTNKHALLKADVRANVPLRFRQPNGL